MRKFAYLLSITTISIVALWILFLYSNSQRISRSFERVIVENVSREFGSMNLGVNSFTLIGVDKDIVYLGNSTAGRLLMTVDLVSMDTHRVAVKIEDQSRLPFRNPTLSTDDELLYLSDPTIPIIMRGELQTLSVSRFISPPGFVTFLPIDANQGILRVFDPIVNSDQLAVLDSSGLVRPAHVLEKQIDGIFCVDGTILYNRELKQVVYVYFYRGEIIVCDTELQILSRIRTIDLTDSARFEVGAWRSGDGEVRTFSSPPLRVNSRVATSGDWLYLNSSLVASNERQDAFDEAFVVDVYNLVDQNYRYSFYLKPPRSKSGLVNFHFLVEDGQLIAVFDEWLVIYTLLVPSHG